MRLPDIHYRWVWNLQSSPEALWPLVADTNRFDRDTGVPKLHQVVDGQRMPNARLRMRQYQYGIPMEQIQEPYEWVYPHRYGVIRHYRVGPLARLRVEVEFQPLPDGGTRCLYEVWARGSNIIGQLGIPFQIGIIFARRFERTFRSYDRLVASGQAIAARRVEASAFAPGGQQRLAAMHDALVSAGGDPELADRLVDTVSHLDGLQISRLRPYALADEWGVPRRDVLELCLLATRAGILEFQWDLLCPMCRNPRDTSHTMGGIKSTVHCDTCNIDFSANFDRSVELTFSLNPAIRPVDRNAYCIGGPNDTPHVVVQQFLQPGEQRAIEAALRPGRYRVRTLELPGGQFLRLDDSQPCREESFTATPGGWSHEEPEIGCASRLVFQNATDDEQLFILERMAWTDQAATAAEVIVLQRFRDLFANEALRPGEQISVGSMAVLFTDLRNSTRLYSEIGDAPAFGIVMSHFDVLREAIDAEEGAIVKTIGDAVMATFRRPAAALRAILRAQAVLSDPSRTQRPLMLKAGIHYGPCIAVTLNERLDYFGSTVNMAARLEGQSSGGDVVISQPVHNDPEVLEMLADPSYCLYTQAVEATLKGFDNQRFGLWLVAQDPSSTTLAPS